MSIQEALGPASKVPSPPKQPDPSEAWDRQPWSGKPWRQGSWFCVEVNQTLTLFKDRGCDFPKAGRSLCLHTGQRQGTPHPLLCPLAAHLLQLILRQGCPLNDTQLVEDACDTLVLEVGGVELPGPHAILQGVLGHGQVLLQLQVQEGTERSYFKEIPETWAITRSTTWYAMSDNLPVATLMGISSHDEGFHGRGTS